MGLKVLLAEDDPLVAGTLLDLLEAEGHRVAHAPDGAAALGLWASAGGSGFDALVTDLDMPRLGGAALVARLRAQRPDLPVVVLSANPPALGSAALTAGYGPGAVLRKPTGIARLAAALEGMRPGPEAGTAG